MAWWCSHLQIRQNVAFGSFHHKLRYTCLYVDFLIAAILLAVGKITAVYQETGYCNISNRHSMLDPVLDCFTGPILYRNKCKIGSYNIL